MDRDASRVGMLREPMLRIASKLHRDSSTKTVLCGKKSQRRRCSRRLSELLPPCNRCFLVYPRSLPPTPPFLSPEKPGRPKNCCPAQFTSDPLALHAHL